MTTQALTPSTRVPLAYYTRLREIRGATRAAFTAYCAEHAQPDPGFYQWGTDLEDFSITLPLARFDSMYAVFMRTHARSAA
jgi:hypothetical protein